MKNIRLLFKSAVLVLPFSMSAAVCDYKLSFDKSMIDFGDVSSVKKMSVKLTNASIGDGCDLNVFRLYSTNQNQGLFSNSDFSGTIKQNSSIDIKVIMTPNYKDNIIKYENSDLVVHAVGVDSRGKKHYIKSWVDYRGIELPKQNIVEVVNGYTLPLEPDAVQNSVTLIGIDSNDNGVRDDVERKIIKTYPKKLQVEILMDGAKTFQKIMEQSTGNATVLQKNFSKLIACKIYLRRLDKNLIPQNFLFSRILKHIIVNNPDRVKKYLDYNIALSGGVYGNTSDAYKREACSKETITVLEEMGL